MVLVPEVFEFFLGSELVLGVFCGLDVHGVLVIGVFFVVRGWLVSGHWPD